MTRHWTAFCTAMMSSCLGTICPAQAEGEKSEVRAYDASAIVGTMRHSPFILRPRGALIFGSPSFSGSSDDDWDGTPLFGVDLKESKGGASPATGGFDSADTSVMDRDAFVEQVSQPLQAAGLESGDDRSPFWWAGSILYVRAPPAVHAAIESFVRPLGEAAGVLIAVECLLVPIDVLDKKAPAWRADGPYLRESLFEEALTDPRAKLLSVVARDGQRVASGSKEPQAFVVDQEVNQTGVIPVINPVVETPFAGDRLEARPSRIPGEDAVWIDVAVGSFRVTSRKSRVGFDWGDLELPVTDETLLSASVVMAPGKALVLGSLGGRDAMVALLRARVRGRVESAAVAPEGRAFRVFDTSLLLRPGPARRWPSAATSYRFSNAEPRFAESDQLVEFLGRSVSKGDEDVFMVQGERLFCSGPASMLGNVERILAEEISRLARVVAVDIDLLGVTREAFVAVRGATDDGFVLKDGWERLLGPEKDVQHRRYTLTGVPGQVHAMTKAILKTFVVDANQVSGGTGFAIIERSDPETATCGDGLEIRVRTDLLPGGRARIQLEGGDVKILEERVVKATFPMTSLTTGSPDSLASPPTGATRAPDLLKEITLTLPRQSVQYWNAEMDVPPGRDVLLHADLVAGEKQATLLVGRVRVVR